MMHTSRRWCVWPATDADTLGQELTQRTRTLCTAFAPADYLFLNDATSENGAQEYAVLKRQRDGTFRQIESITFGGWCTVDEARSYVREILAGQYDEAGVTVSPRLETWEQHRRCHCCA
jgi:hypothetical protein